MTVTAEQWKQMCEVVRDQMAHHVWPLVTPISKSETPNRGFAWGTGNYVELRGSAYLLTNAHVVEEAVGAHLGHLPGPTDEYVRCYNAFQLAEWPVDMALMRLGDEWNTAGQSAVPASRLDQQFAPIQNEVLFFLGFPGSTATRHESVTELNIRNTWFGSPLQNMGVPMLTQAFPGSPTDLRAFDSEKHVAIHFPARAHRNANGPEEEVPNPKGMSGSFLWDTKFVATTSAGENWTPEHARVCGLVWAAHSRPEVIVATKIEHWRNILLHFLREEAAHFHWIDRGRPLWEEMIDWTWSEQNVLGLEV